MSDTIKDVLDVMRAKPQQRRIDRLCRHGFWPMFCRYCSPHFWEREHQDG